jgi:hypothetical protein
MVGGFSVQGAFAHRVIAVVGEKYRIFGTDGCAVRALKHPIAPRAEKVAVAVEDDHRVFAAGEAIKLVFVIDCHRSDFVKSPVIGQFSKTFDDFISILSASQYDTHCSLLIITIRNPRSSILS